MSLRSTNKMLNKSSTVKKTNTTHQLAHQIKDKIIPFLKDEVWTLWLDSLKGTDIFYCLEIASNSIRLLKIERRNGKPYNITSQVEPISKNTSDEIENLSLALTFLFSKIKYRGEEIFVHLSPERDILNKIVEIELTEFKSVQEWIIANRQRVFPNVDEEEIVFDYCIIGEEGRKKYLYLSIGRREKINRLLEIIEKLHLNLESLSAGSVGLYHYLKERDILEENKNLAIILFNDRSAEVTLCDKGIPIYTTQLPHDFQSAKSPNNEGLFHKEANEFINGLKKIIDFHCEKTKATGDLKILLLGKEELTKTLSDVLKNNGIDLIDHSHLFKLPARISNRSTLPANLYASFCMLVGNKQMPGISFLPSPRPAYFLNPKPFKKAFNYSLKVFASFLLVLALLNLGFLVYEIGNSQKLQRFESKMEILSDLTERNKILADKLESAQNLEVNRSETSQLLFALSEIAPKEIWLREIIAGESQESSPPFLNKIEIAGFATSEKAVTEFLSNLERSKYFAQVQIESQEKTPAQKTTKIPQEYRKSIFKFKINLLSRL
jgi:hypothetical protein